MFIHPDRQIKGLYGICWRLFSTMDRLIAMGWLEGNIMDAVMHGARRQMIDFMINTIKNREPFRRFHVQ